MENKDTRLNLRDWSADLPLEATRDGFGKGLLELGKMNKNVVGLCADLAESTRMHWFRDEFPERYIEVGVAEQNLAGVAGGFANVGKIPFLASYAAFSPGRNFEQIRTIGALSELPIKIVGCHAGVSVGPDGATHQALEDIGLMRMLPNMTVIAPCDSEQARKATIAIADIDGPVYLRLAREKSEVITTENTPFEVGKGYRYVDYGIPDVSIFVTGNLAYEAIKASERLFKDKGMRVNVLCFPTIKPLDKSLILEEVDRVKAIVTVEEHQIAGGFGSAVSEFLSSVSPVVIGFVGVADKFGQSGTKEELYNFYGLDAKHIKRKVETVYGMIY